LEASSSPKLDWSRASRALIRANLAAFERCPSDSDVRHAAVAIALLRGDGGEVAFPLFLRNRGLGRHPGQMALPGGRLEEGENAPAAALRELEEEVGLKAGPESILGLLDDFETRSGFVMTPVVVWADASPRDLRQVPGGEVARLFVITLSDLGRAAATAKPGTSSEFSLPFAFGNVYAPTAAILYQFNEVGVAGSPVRVNDFYQPPFTWR
jgi:8-oxo-dGTP pyrophosphatase MutT (NUDIX family)